ncbi:MAG TPA: DNA ligase D [Thermoanaerobaculia bacterium]|nr:DNA ligase D [Thermoanaerobaculia bacterium]
MSSPEQLLRRVFPPMLATLAGTPPRDEENWTYELKYDGFRAVCAITGGRVAMWSRNELDLEPRFPRIAEALGKIRGPEMVLDGEVVALDAEGAPRFQLLQQGEHREKLFVFDILWLDGHDLRRLTYKERRSLLERALKKAPAPITISKILEPPGQKALDDAAKAGWEGIIAKKNSSCYEPRRSRDWLKLKALNEQEFVIVGWQPSTHSSKEIGSLHLAVRGHDGDLHYAGKVGTGFSYKMRVALKDELSKNIIPKTEVKDAPRNRDAVWVKPRLVGQVAFTEWTADNRLRHPSFLGLRDDKKPEEVVREKAQSVERRASSRRECGPGTAAAPRVTLSNPDRLLYPRDKITKEDVAKYYDLVAEPMLRALRDRPLSLEHWNQGIDKPSWFHQNLGREAPEWLTTVETPTRASSRKTVKHLVADSRDALRWLAQMSVLTIHMWHSREGSLEEPDWVVFDLDPAKGKGIEQAIEAAVVLRKLLEHLEVPSYPKTSGKRGIHVLVPLVSGYTHEQAHDFACSLAAAVTSKVPFMTVERSIAKRRGRLYLDCEQNAYGKTIVGPYSLRAIDGAPVSAPLQWSEVNKKLDPLKFNLKTMPKRLDKVGDLFEDVLKKKAKLPKLT